MINDFKDLLTIVIPCKNEGLIIKQTLEFLNAQFNIKGTNVIIADVSDDAGFTHECIESQQNKNINISIIKGGYPAQGRNAGAALVKTQYVLFLDADIYLRNVTLLADLIREVVNRKAKLATCKFRVIDGEYNFVYQTFDVIQWFTKFSKPFAIGGFMLFETETFNLLGGFKNDDKFAEDYHLSMNILPKDFYVHNDKIYTTSRRFKSKGLSYMVKMMILSYFNRNNAEFFTKDHNYWK
ncbi:MAG: glycosyltransferase [Candidatus Pacearchaeota archaeon]|jgi:glycosyltransferase involved in cell wall biosynthesis|nr:glycosyltransferase [Clostridia bacterium]